MVSDLKTFTNKGCKIAQPKKCFLANFALLSRICMVSVFLIPFNSLFAPTSWSQMSKHFGFLESFGKSNGKKWSQIKKKLLLIKGAKLPKQKKGFTDFLLLHLFSLFKRLFAPTSWSPISKMFRFLKSFEKSNEKKWSKILKLMLIKSLKLPHNFCLLFFWRILPY